MGGGSTFGRLLALVPGKQQFGVYRFLPFFFVLGGAMEWFMINVRLGPETFYDVYRRRQSERRQERRLEEELMNQTQVDRK
ncbi:hypothetical protein XENTR_v10013044 [Xenopus tropicalis]|uniref:Polybromo 1 n=1 Tax=Xenopus tropicalis TaxID=8364 RepID=A0A803KBK6_XENTR|nr:small integral membrane protein 4 [Xenopus tropicalis]KAE8612923.1 hypothetical protein XENTR_v10013044 [Xenopus tropicalis]